MSREERILRMLRPGEVAFSEEELSFVREVLSVADGKSDKASSLPSRFVPIGGLIDIRGRVYRCVIRSDVHWVDCCSGCSLRGVDCPSFLQCSKFDRRDGMNVWFREV